MKVVATVLAFAKKQRAITALIVLNFLIALALGWCVTAGIRGKLAARYDVWRGHYYDLAYGFPSHERPEYARLLKERYGIEMRAVAYCIVSGTERRYVDSYDNVSAAAANRKFGHDVFEECWRDAHEKLLASK